MRFLSGEVVLKVFLDFEGGKCLKMGNIGFYKGFWENKEGKKFWEGEVLEEKKEEKKKKKGLLAG